MIFKYFLKNLVRREEKRWLLCKAHKNKVEIFANFVCLKNKKRLQFDTKCSIMVELDMRLLGVLCEDARGCSWEKPTPVREFSRSMSEHRANAIRERIVRKSLPAKVIRRLTAVFIGEKKERAARC